MDQSILPYLVTFAFTNMLKNLLQVTLRNLIKNKVYVIINVIGLGLALALCIVAYHNHQFAFKFDHNHTNLDNLYKINVRKNVNDQQMPYGITPFPLGDAIANDVSGINGVSRYMTTFDAVKYQDNVFNIQIGYGDDDYLEMFTFPLIEGNKNDFKDPSKIFLTEETAIKYFGSQSAVGKQVSLSNDNGKIFDFIVGGVFENIPLNTSMRFQALTNAENFHKIIELEDNDKWRRFINATFLKIDDASNLSTIENNLNKYVAIQNENRQDWKVSSFYLEQFSTVGFTGRDMRAHWLWEAMHPAAIVAPSIMAILILLIACFNFTNTSISFSNKRLKEIGVRKVLGGSKRQLIAQFLGENMLLCILALLVGLLMASYLVPAYSTMWEYLDLEMVFAGNMRFYLFLAGLLLFTGFVAGIYPALYVSSFDPVRILGSSLKIKGSGLFSKILLTFQFTISIVALVSGVVFTQNAIFQNNLDLGYENKELIAVPVNNKSQFESFKNEVANHVDVKEIAGTSSHISWSSYSRTIKDQTNKEMESNVLNVGLNYLKTMNMHLINGRDFDPKREENDIQESIIVNKYFAEQFAWENPIGQKIIMQDTLQFNIVGVVDNFYLQDFFEPIEPTMFRLAAEENQFMIVAQVEKDKIIEMNKHFEAVWKQQNPYAPYRGFYQEEQLENAKEINNNIMYIFLFLSVMAIVLSAIGLFTLVSMNILSRIKELGVRKVLGATISHLASLINKQFAIILIIASLIGTVLGYFITDILMASIYAVYIDMNIISLMLPVILTFLFAILTIGGKVYNAATRNPVESLRYE